MVALNWLSEHWFDLLQTAGIIGGLLFTGVTLRTDAKAKRLLSLFTITKSHRDIWMEISHRPELSRILDANANVSERSVTNEERLFVNFLIIHLKNVYQASFDGLYVPPEVLGKDIAGFLELPIPHSVWQQVREFQDSSFVSFVESATASPLLSALFQR